MAPGQAVVSVTLLARQVQVALDSSLQSDVKVGDEVSIVMPNNATLPGLVTYVGTVASACQMAFDKPTAKALVATAGLATPPSGRWRPTTRSGISPRRSSSPPTRRASTH